MLLEAPRPSKPAPRPSRHDLIIQCRCVQCSSMRFVILVFCHVFALRELKKLKIWERLGSVGSVCEARLPFIMAESAQHAKLLLLEYLPKTCQSVHKSIIHVHELFYDCLFVYSIFAIFIHPELVNHLLSVFTIII